MNRNQNNDRLGGMARGTPPRAFGETHWSLVFRAAGASTEASREALATLCENYREPLLGFARRLEPDPNRAEDLVQGFLVRLIEKDVLGQVDPRRARFRTFLRSALRYYATNVYHAETAIKRGGQAHFVEADPDDIAGDGSNADRLLDRLWARALIDRALHKLEEEYDRAGKKQRFDALCPRLAGDGGGTHEAAGELGMSYGAFKVALFRFRQRFAHLVRAEVAETVATPEEVDAELRDLRGEWTEDD